MATSNKKRVQIQVDDDLSTHVEQILEGIGLTPTAAITAYYKRIAATGGIPFDLTMTPSEIANLDLRNAVMDSSLETKVVNDWSEMSKEWDDNE